MKYKTLFTSVIFIMFFLSNLSAQKKKQNIFKQLFGVSVNETSDKFDGTTTYQMDGNRVPCELSGVNALGNLIFGTDAATFSTFLNLEKHILKDGSSEVAILFKVEAQNEQFAKVQEGESLIFLLDDSRINLNTQGSFNSDFDIDINGPSSVTHARYSISKSQLKQINESNEVAFRIILDSYRSGSAESRDKNEQHLDGSFTKKNTRVWNEFYNDYLTTN